MRFCGHCGSRLERRQETAERRQLTVVFCDLVGSSALAEALDPEEYGDLLVSFQVTVTEEVREHGGHVAQILGDGVLAYFGYPVAYENSPDLAVGASAAVIRRLESASRKDADAGRPISRARIGIHTGSVIFDPTSPVEERRNLAFGSAPNVAARLQQHAEPDAILLSEETRRLLVSSPELIDLGPQELRGLSKPVHIYEVVAGDTDLEVSGAVRSTAETPMVNREVELEALDRHWQQAGAGDGRIVLIEGEPGVGKSRLASHFASSLGATAEVLVANCSPLRTESALFPLRLLLRSTLDLVLTDDPQTQLDHLCSELSRTGLSETAASTLGFLLRLPVDDPWLEDAAPELRRRETHFALRRWVFSFAERRPLLLIFEDLQWSDPSSLEWLADLTLELERHRVLVVVTGHAGAGQGLDAEVDGHLALGGLEERHAEELVRGIAGEELPEAWLKRLKEQTDGVPLYLEELTHAVLDAVGDEAPAAREWPELGVPSTLQGLLTAHLDRLGASKGLAQWAAVLGRSFPLAALRMVAPNSGDFDRELFSLVRARVLERETVAGAHYRFRHALVFEAAHRSLLHSDRRARHLSVAEAFSSGTAGVVAGPGEIAHHFAEAGVALDASKWWLEAGKEALGRSDNQESVTFLRRGIAAVEPLDEPERDGLLLGLKGALATALTAIRGYAATEVEELQSSVQIRARRLSDPRATFLPLWRTISFYLVRAQHDRARTIGEELLELSNRLGDSSLRLEAHLGLATACFWLGDAVESRRNALLGLELYEPKAHAKHAVLFGQEPGVLCHLYAGWSTWWLGRFDEARRHAQRALELARTLGHPHTLAMALDHACALEFYLQEFEEGRALVSEQLEISKRYGFSMWSAMAGLRTAWLDCLAGEFESGIARMKAGLTAFRATGAEIARPLHLSYLARAYLASGQGEEGLTVVDDALGAAQATREGHYVAELHRLGGELALQADGGLSERARGSFLTAIDVARSQGCLALELRAALSWQRVAEESDRSAAVEGLQKVVGLFESAGDAPDLEDAREVLESLRLLQEHE